MSTKIITRTCNICQERITGDKAVYEQHGNEHHPDHFLQGFDVKCLDPRYSEKKYWCPLDNQWYASRTYLARAIKNNGWTQENYYDTYGKEYMPVEWTENENHPKVGNAHNTKTCLQCNGETKFTEGKWTYSAFCGFSCSTKWYAVNSNRIDTAMQTLRERKALDPNLHLRPNQKQYWINKGLTDEEAIAKVKIRNAVNSLDNYIKRAGGDVEKGTADWKARQVRWQKTLNAKSDVEKERIRLAKITHSSSLNYSTISQKLFNEVVKEVPDIKFGAYETTIRLSDMFVKPDCSLGKKIIEFYGDYWHGNPAIYPINSAVARGQLVQNVWARDALRLSNYIDKGYDVLIVWESEYNADKAGTIERCIDFLRKDNDKENIN